MTRSPLTDNEVQAAMDAVLHNAKSAGRRPTIAAVERRLDTTHATFYRNFQHKIEWFRQQAALDTRTSVEASDTPSAPNPAETIASLRRENTQLRRTVAIYAEVIRQLSVDYEESRSQVERRSGVADLNSRRNRRMSPPNE